MMFFDEDAETDNEAGETACAYTNDFLDAAVEKIDATFGKGYAKANPALVGAYIQASSANLGAFMQAASSSMAGMLADAMEDMEIGDEDAGDLLSFTKPKGRN